MRTGTGLARAKFTLLSRFGSASRTTDGEHVFRAEFFFHHKLPAGTKIHLAGSYVLSRTDMGRLCRKLVISSLFICKPPLYWTKPFFLNPLMNLLTLARVVPTISAKVAWLTFRGRSGFDSLIICPNSNKTRASRFSLKLKN